MMFRNKCSGARGLPGLTLALPVGLLALLALTGTWARAAQGGLDTDFNASGATPGVLTVDIVAAQNDKGEHVCVLDDGNVLVSGYADSGGVSGFGFVMADQDGPVYSFGGNGGVRLVNPTGDHYEARASGQQSGGRIVAAGLNDATPPAVALASFTKTGQMDISFSGDGWALPALTGLTVVDVVDMAILDDDRIVVAGYADDGGGTYDVFVARLTGEGEADTTFGGGDGWVSADYKGQDGYATSLAVTPEGKYVVAGAATDGTTWNLAAVRFSADGAVDTGFADNGWFWQEVAVGNDSTEANGVCVGDDGSIILAGGYWYALASRDDGLLLKLDSAGDPVTGFGDAGRVVFSAGESGLDYTSFRDCFLGDDGRAYAFGWLGPSSGDEQFCLAGFTPAGDPDPDFGTSGTGYTLANLAGTNLRGFSMAVDADGDIVGGGSADINAQFAVARYEANVALSPVGSSADDESLTGGCMAGAGVFPVSLLVLALLVAAGRAVARSRP
jgi:uncharacterized delta-60 repeat protein